MELTRSLMNEFESFRPEGVYAQSYFKAIGLRKHPDAPMSLRRAEAVVSELTEPKAWIYPSDVIAGSWRPLVEILPEDEFQEARSFVRDLPERDFTTHADHYAPDYRMITTLGIPGMLNFIDLSMQAHGKEPDRLRFLSEMKIAFSGFRSFVQGYAEKAESLKGSKGYNDERLSFIADNCKAIVERAPETFAEALQLVWFCHLAFCYEGRYAMALGRMDQYLYPFFAKDIERGTLTEEKATELLENAFAKIHERPVLFHGGDDVVNICIGGTSPDGSCDVNRLSYCVLHAVKNCNVPGPNLSARITHHTPDDFLDECLQSIGTGLGYPALMNDEVNLAALGRYGYEPEDLYNYCMVGCIENFITGKQPPWNDGRFDTPRYFEYLFNRGKGIRIVEESGIDTGDVSEISSMDELMRRYEQQIAYGAKKYVESFNRKHTLPHPEDLTSPFLSCFARECIERGLDINMGGTKYPSVHGACMMGIGTVCDSLAAIEKVVFVDHEATLQEIGDAMRCNFEGMEDLRAKLLAAPKYGNNDPFVDKYAEWFVRFSISCFDQYRTYDGGYYYTAMAANTANIYSGKGTSATPDGRLAMEPISDAASPTYGRDVNGPTATVLSLSVPNYCVVACGSVVNQKFMPSMFTDENRKKLAALIRVYFKRGGQEMQINSVSPDVLRAAMITPEEYENLIVRVSGFSAYYTQLNRDTQNDILNRTEHFSV